MFFCFVNCNESDNQADSALVVSQSHVTSRKPAGHHLPCLVFWKPISFKTHFTRSTKHRHCCIAVCQPELTSALHGAERWCPQMPPLRVPVPHARADVPHLGRLWHRSSISQLLVFYPVTWAWVKKEKKLKKKLSKLSVPISLKIRSFIQVPSMDLWLLPQYSAWVRHLNTVSKILLLQPQKGRNCCSFKLNTRLPFVLALI